MFDALTHKSCVYFRVRHHFTEAHNMTKVIYDIFLEDNKIATTELEKADVPMGVVFGRIHFINIVSGYDYFRNYCLLKNIELLLDYPEDKLILTRTIENLLVKNNTGVEVKSSGNQISGTDSDEFGITLEGVPYLFYEKEFPHHVKDYEKQLKEDT